MEQLMHYESLNFSEAVNRATNRIFQISGRARRSEYWWTMLLVLIVSMAVPFAGVLLNLLTIPLTFRRLHDTGRSGWWWWFQFIPLVGPLTMVFFLCSKGNPVENKYGPNPCADVLGEGSECST